MEYPGRNRDEGKFAERLAALSSAERRELRDLMGWPPNADNVPDSFWQEAAERRQQEAFMVLYLMFLGSADYHLDDDNDADSDRLDGLATVYAEDASRRISSKYQGRSQAAFDRLRRRIEETTGADGKTSMTKGELEDELGKVAGPDRDAEAAATAATEAQTAGGDAAAAETFQLSALDIWINQPHLTRTGPCERCEALHDKPRNEWANIEPDAGEGPPLHDWCACIVEYQNAGVGI